MARKVFFSFHFTPDNWRASQVRQIGSIEGNQSVSDNDWEKVTKAGDQAIKNWIAGQMNGKSCEVVLIGAETAGRKWIKYEIEEAWKAGKGVVGIYVHHLRDAKQEQSKKGANPFLDFKLNGTNFGSIVKAYDPPYVDSKQAYKYIADNIEAFVEEAIAVRGKH